MKPKISIITSFYNMDRFIDPFLKNVSNQSYFKYSELVINLNEPGSKVLNQIKKFKKKYSKQIKIIIRKKVVPLAVSWNKCIKVSSGQYLAIWNIDDFRTTRSLEMQSQILKKYNKISFVYGNFTEIDKYGKKYGKYISIKKFKKDELKKSMILGPFFMFRKKVVKKIGYFDEQLKQGIDFDFAIRLAYFFKGKAIKKNLGFYLNEKKGESTKPNSLQPIEACLIYLRYCIFNKLFQNIYLIPFLINYDVKNYFFFGQKHNINNFFSNYEKFYQKKLKIYKLKSDKAVSKTLKSYIKKISSYILK